MKYRKDNKKLLLWVYTIFIGGIITSLIINVLNTKTSTGILLNPKVSRLQEIIEEAEALE